MGKENQFQLISCGTDKSIMFRSYENVSLSYHISDSCTYTIRSTTHTMSLKYNSHNVPQVRTTHTMSLKYVQLTQCPSSTYNSHNVPQVRTTHTMSLKYIQLTQCPSSTYNSHNVPQVCTTHNVSLVQLACTTVTYCCYKYHVDTPHIHPLCSLLCMHQSKDSPSFQLSSHIAGKSTLYDMVTDVTGYVRYNAGVLLQTSCEVFGIYVCSSSAGSF